MQEYLYNQDAYKQINKTFKLISDLIVPTMGARGRLAAIDNNFGKPNLTDDGVTVAKALNNLSGWDRSIGKSIIEAAHNTEAEAFDGTTLTVLLTYELYKYGRQLISKGDHPNVAVDKIQEQVQEVFNNLEEEILPMTPDNVRDIATIATKIPEMGDIIKKAYDIVGESMDVLIEWNRGSNKTDVSHDDGYSLRGGYMMEQLSKGLTSGEGISAAIMRTGLSTENQVSMWIESIPENCKGLIYFVGMDFNPEGMRKIINFHSKKNIPFNFVFISSSDIDEILQDVAAISNGKVQDPTSGIKNYKFEHTGTLDNITIERNKTIIKGSGDKKDRIKYYQDKLESKKYQTNSSDKILDETKLAALKHGVATIKVGVPTEAAFSTIKLKLDDAKGAVYKSFQDGIVMGGGKALVNASSNTDIQEVMQAPFKTILNNAGIQAEPKDFNENEGIDVNTRKTVNLVDAGIIDSYSSIQHALNNALSIATSYLKVYMLIKNKDPK